MHLLRSTVDISITKHKYAILDVCQRLPASILVQFAQNLNVPPERVRTINADSTLIEEKYYQVYK